MLSAKEYRAQRLEALMEVAGTVATIARIQHHTYLDLMPRVATMWKPDAMATRLHRSGTNAADKIAEQAQLVLEMVSDLSPDALRPKKNLESIRKMLDSLHELLEDMDESTNGLSGFYLRIATDGASEGPPVEMMCDAADMYKLIDPTKSLYKESAKLLREVIQVLK